MNGYRSPQGQCNLVVGRQAAFDCEWQRDRRVVPAAEADQRPGPARHLNIVCGPLEHAFTLQNDLETKRAVGHGEDHLLEVELGRGSRRGSAEGLVDV